MDDDQAIEKLSKMYAECFSSQAGMYVLEDMKREYSDSTFINLYSKDPVDMVKVTAREAQRAVYLRILQLMEKAVEFTLKEAGPLTDAEIAIAAKLIHITEADQVPLGDI